MSAREIEHLRVTMARLERVVDANYDFLIATRNYLYDVFKDIYQFSSRDSKAIRYLYGRMSDMHELVGPLAGVNLPNIDHAYDPAERVLDPLPSPGERP